MYKKINIFVTKETIKQYFIDNAIIIKQLNLSKNNSYKHSLIIINYNFNIYKTYFIYHFYLLFGNKYYNYDRAILFYFCLINVLEIIFQSCIYIIKIYR